MSKLSFQHILTKYRELSFSQKDKGARFERLMQAYLLTDPMYAEQLEKVWLWDEFPYRDELGGNDTGIDLVALTNRGDFWAIQCKCYHEQSTIDKPAVDSFLATSSRDFKDEKGLVQKFSNRIWISTTNKWGPNAEQAIKNQNPPVTRISLYDLQQAPVDWEKMENGVHGEKARLVERDLREHQKKALELTHEHFKNKDRGKLIMACGTGKTFTALRIAENETKNSGSVLFLVPSIALLGQTLREWSTFSKVPINAICICSDPEITKARKKNDDIDTTSVVDLALPASTDVTYVLNQFSFLKNEKKPGMTVVFSTYQSIEVIAKVQNSLEVVYGEGSIFDLIICDEAHRTTGVSLADEDERAFTKVHNNDFIKARKRLYMTATPRLYDDNTKSKAAQAEALLCSMDDEKFYGDEIYRIGFGEAVERDLLTDYKVLILTLNENDVPPAVQRMIADKESEINSDDASKLIGCINALSKQVLGDEGIIKDTDPEPMRRAVAFCQNINVSKKITATFNSASETYISELPKDKQSSMQLVASKHIDGSMNATMRDDLLGWLKDEPEPNECRILTNVRCLSEGVDVPSLDAVLFLSARNSQVDVVQSVGRVMRRAPGKKYGYIIIPVVVPADVEADKALDDNERYKVVWTVLNALRAHDDRFNATVNKIELNKQRPEQILVGRPEVSFDEYGNPIYPDYDNGASGKNISEQLSLQFQQLQSVVFARMVQKVGDRRYWEQWAKNVAEIAERQVIRIKQLVKDNGPHQAAFDKFLEGLQKNINPSISEQEAIDMLSQHIITKPVFEALFEGYSFVKNNPISVSMQNMLDLLEDQSFDKDAETLDKFYESVRMRAAGIDNAEGKQRIIIELYDKFFKTAFPKMVEQLGIVYTPVEVVDFIIHSVNDVLKQEFDRSLSDENVHILDPFTGTGTFLTRLLQSGLIEEKDLERKYRHELHANELVLLAYYIASVNIENAFHDILGNRNLELGFSHYPHSQNSIPNSQPPFLNPQTPINDDKNEILQRTDSLARGNESSRDDLYSDKAIPKGRTVWVDESNSESGSLNSSEHSRRIWKEVDKGISPILGDSERITDRTGNSHLNSTENTIFEHSRIGEDSNAIGKGWENIDRSEKIPKSDPLNTQTPIPNSQTPIPRYIPFDGIVLTDTFQLGESDNSDKMFSEMFPQNSERVERQKKAPLRVIIGNPPYSIGQKSANDNAQNQSYPTLDKRIAKTYAEKSNAGLNKSLYDAYIKAFRWSTDRLDKNGGVIAFVSNGAWLDGNSTDGFRKALEEEFDKIYVFNLRGNQRTSGELSRKEGGKIFGSGSRTPIAVTLLVKKSVNS
jgi:predicted helicase